MMLVRTNYHSNCSNDFRAISPSEGNFEAVVEEECCSGFASWCAVRIKLRKIDGWGFDTEIFVYNPTFVYEKGPWTHEPLVVWLSPNELDITVDRVGSIHKQLSKARGVKIEYHIVSVDYP